MTTDLKTAITNATTWLRANPDKHVKATLATNDAQERVSPTSPEATCFCAAGRVLKELNLNIAEDLDEVGLNYNEIWSRNDGFAADVGDNCPVDEERKKNYLGQVCALDYLDRVAAKL